MISNCFTIGRSSSNDLCIADQHVSRFHARLIREPDGLYIENLSHSSFTSVNGQVVNRCRVNPGDRVDISNYFQLDWNDPALRTWLSGERSQRLASAGHRKGIQAGGIKDGSGMVLETPSSLWLVLGIFFFISYFVPMAEDIFFWHAFDYSAINGITYLYIALAGLASIIVAYAVRGTGRAIALSSIGFVGLVLFLAMMLSSGGYAGQDILAGGIFGLLSFLTLIGMLLLNNVTISFPDHDTVRLVAGILASVYAALATFVQVLIIIELADIGLDEPYVAVSMVLGLLCYLALLTSSILIIVNIKKRFSTRSNARIAERLALWAILAQLIFTSFIIAMSSYSDGGWVFFLFLRLFIFLMGLALLFAGGLADLIKAILARTGRLF